MEPPEEREARTAAQDGLRLGANTTARLAGATEREDALETSGSAPPERDLGEDVEPDQEVELRLGRQERWELEEPRIACRLAEEDDPSGGEGEGARFGDGRSGTADVGLVQLEGRSELDDRARGVEDRGEVVARLAVAASVPNQPRTREQRVERRLDLVGAAFEEVRVQTLEPLSLLDARARGLDCSAKRERRSGSEVGACLGGHDPPYLVLPFSCRTCNPPPHSLIRQ